MLSVPPDGLEDDPEAWEEVSDASARLNIPANLAPPSPWPCSLPAQPVARSLSYRFTIMSPRMLPTCEVRNPYLQSWFPLSLQDAALFPALLSSTLTHRRARCLLGEEWPDGFDDQDRSLLAACYAHTVSALNGVLRQPLHGVSDATLLAVLMLVEGPTIPVARDWTTPPVFRAPLQGMQWLKVHGARKPHEAHQRGLCRLVQLKGGLSRIQLPGVAAAISFRLLVNATLTLSVPPLPFHPLSEGSAQTVPEFLASCADAGSHGSGRFAEVGLPADMRPIFEAMALYTAMVEQYLRGEIARPDTQAMCDQRNLIQHGLLSLHPAEGSSDSARFYEVCRASALIFSVGVIFPLPAATAPFAALVQTLRTHLGDAPPLEDGGPAFPAAPALRLWIIAMGGIAATGTPEREWFVGRLQHSARQAGLGEWQALRQSLQTILWLDSACDAAGEQLWTEAQELRPWRPARPVPARPTYGTQLDDVQGPRRREPPCTPCRNRGVRCNKGLPCQTCVRHGIRCSYGARDAVVVPARVHVFSMRRQPCQLCKQRKVRCERQRPCQSCVKAGLTCIPLSRS
ncbi:Cys6 transcription factor domain-containing protein [Aspergillus ibericus CBS 121593]|uniref:Zn(2)-C6 fungal-type domain-containing protein n=1 Tax=Aspergillus ibericus CBS 121593 TaxID=1448316 RepID=A0A395GKK8_9EURO|nr:hypothetical protein BO80DRAFT_429537 [Aspergillus ibericus CBS 121593]RAK95934.1 hypothetical protein BO80DRAFT_429537 [Aspergillus ibericus CBS 121593]